MLGTRQGADPLAGVLLRRFGLLAPGLLPGVVKVKPKKRQVSVSEGLVALEADVLARGFLLSGDLRTHLASLPADRLAGLGLALLSELDTIVGGHVPHVPLFRSFPREIPENTLDLYVDRVFALLAQEPAQPCALCGTADVVSPVAPCAHLVCGRCFDLDNYAGCPICHGRIDPCGVLPEPAGPRVVGPLPRRARMLYRCEGLDRTVYRAVATLLARRTPLSPAERADLQVLLDRIGPGLTAWLPESIPVRETRALVLARLTGEPDFAELVLRHTDTATDLLRLLWVWHGGDPGLTTPPPRRRSVPRALRRAVLARLDALPVAALVEDLHRHRGGWLRIAENLHPFEHLRRYPLAALAFAALRGSEVTPELAATAGRYPDTFRITDGRLRTSRPARLVEDALRAGRSAEALAAVRGRPGELFRRLVALAARGDAPNDLVEAALDTAPAVAPGVLVAALGALRAATWPSATRLYFPKGGTARLWTEPDHRPRLPADLGGDLEQVVVAELLDRAARLPRVPVAVLDAGLADLPAPFAERTAAASLVALPRGASLPLPDARTLRLFLHWTEPAGFRIDLDLSVAMYDADGELHGWCDYTRLRLGGTAAVHSGDLTSAPAPLGASEFVDLDLRMMHKRGVRYVTMIVFSYNDVPFEAMTDAFAGLMAEPGSATFDPRAVEHRFDLTGNAKIATPLILDLGTDTIRWVDATLGARGSGHSVAGYSRSLGLLTAAVDRYFAAGRRVSMWELACLHAAARADRIVVRHPDDRRTGYARGAAEPVAAFLDRVRLLGPADEPGDTAEAGFAALVRGDVGLAEGAECYATYPGELDPARVTVLTAADLLAALGPA
ncbi:MXAN_6230/SCO0854 family RING domain-containing protein [Longispora sp. K20-0274]|uniref:MXAN_6230/SCO0854 family RING domain-containing protein n=1 Tax=Longispora sp. K20-0274 TaxID=3088255 RepID=UPI00399ACCDD